MGIKIGKYDTFLKTLREQRYKPVEEQSNLFKEWTYHREETLLKIIREELSELDYTPSAILIDGNALSILYKYFECKVSKYDIDGIKCIRTWDKINYFKFVKGE